MKNVEYPFIAPTSLDSRSPCPALNTLANHGYLPRDGKDINISQLTHALRQVYGVSAPLAYGLAGAGMLRCGHEMKLDLHDLSKHNVIEHDASLVHYDIAEGDQSKINPALIQAIVDLSDGKEVTLEDLKRAKVKRETNVEYAAPKTANRIFSRGEAVLQFMCMHQGEDKMPVEWFQKFYAKEELPDGYKPTETTGLVHLFERMIKIDHEITVVEQAEKKKGGCQ